MIEQAPIAKVMRSQINEAPYNPRRISEGNKKRLKKSLKEFGMVGDIVWNKRTGTLVSGHQRIAIMDGEVRGKDYEVEVRVVDLDEKQEAKLNVILNNSDTQGEYDFGAVKDLADSLGFDLSEAGFSLESLEVDFGFDTALDERAAQDIGDAKQHKLDSRASSQKAGANGEINATDANHADYGVVLVFESNAAKSSFVGKMGFAGNAKSVRADLFIATLRQKIEQGLL